MHAGEASFPRCTSDQTGTNVQPQSSHLFVRSQSAAFQRTKSAAEEQAEKSMELIMQLKAGLADVDGRAASTMASCKAILEACGEAIKSFFSGLSGPALERAIKEAFDRFDSDKSGLLDQEEFQKAMHTLGLRLSATEYVMLFNEYDVDSSGSIDLQEFSAMVKRYIKVPSSGVAECAACGAPHAIYGENWVDDDKALPIAATTLKMYAVSALVREENGFLATHRAKVNMEISRANAQKAAEETRLEEERRKRAAEEARLEEERRERAAEAKQREHEEKERRRRERKRREEDALARQRAEEERQRAEEERRMRHEQAKKKQEEVRRIRQQYREDLAVEEECDFVRTLSAGGGGRHLSLNAMVSTLRDEGAKKERGGETNSQSDSRTKNAT